MTVTTFGDVFTAALRGEPCEVSIAGSETTPFGLLPTHRWRGKATAVDREILRHCHGSTIDIGCGPGRMAEALAQRGRAVLAIDIVEEAVEQTRARGVSVLRRDVFDRLPGEGRWDSALLADGNIGIGGSPIRLLSRVAELVRPGGRIVAEIAGPDDATHVVQLILQTAGQESPPLPWALVGHEGIGPIAAESGLSLLLLQPIRHRWVAVLERPA